MAGGSLYSKLSSTQSQHVGLVSKSDVIHMLTPIVHWLIMDVLFDYSRRGCMSNPTLCIAAFTGVPAWWPGHMHISPITPVGSHVAH